MLKYNLKRVMRARGQTKYFTYLRKQGYAPNTASRLLNEHVKTLNLKQVEHLCLLLDCTPNDLLDWDPGKDITEPKKKALADLIRTDEVSRVSQLLYQVPMSELKDVAQYLKSKIEEKEK